MREGLAIIVIIAIIALLIDGFRKYQVKNSLKIKLEKSPPGDASDISGAELPSGGARTRPRDDSGLDMNEPYISEDDDIHPEEESDEQEGTSFRRYEQKSELYDDDEKIMDDDSEHVDTEISEEPLTANAEDAPVRSRLSRSKDIPAQVFQPELPLQEDQAVAAEKEDAENEFEVEEVIIINVMARSGETLNGAQMLPVLMKHGLSLGNMSLFHRHAKLSGEGRIMFSLANMVKPGTFDMAQMETFTTPGVSLFMQLPSSLNYMESFNIMLETAEALRVTLGADLKDENRSVLTRQTVEHYRQRIRDFELQQLARNSE